MTRFALRTTDAEWIKRHDGRFDEAGRVVVLVPGAEEVNFAGHAWLRHTFADIPADFANGAVMCLASWVQ